MNGSVESYILRNLNSNVNSIQLALTISHPACDDAGVYTCEFKFNKHGSDSHTCSQTVTAEGK